MAIPPEEFQKRLLATFRVEAHEHLDAIEAGLVALEQVPTAVGQIEIVETTFRETHSLKGAARAVNLAGVEVVCQAVEDVFATLQHEKMTVFTPVLDLLHMAVSMLRDMLMDPETPADKPYDERVVTLVNRLQDIVSGGLPSERPGGAIPETESVVERLRVSEPEAGVTWLDGGLATRETIRVSSVRLASMLLQAETLLGVTWTTSQRAAKLWEAQTHLAAWLKACSKLRHDVHEARCRWETAPVAHEPATQESSLRRLLEFFDWSWDMLQPLDRDLAELRRAVEYERDTMGRAIEELLEKTKQMLMVPFSVLLASFPPFVRRLARAQGKEAELVVAGGSVEIDRRVLEGIKDPLLHLVHNCIDHGLEMPRERERRQKPRRGRITIAMAQKDARSVELKVSDDGAGVNTEAVKVAAVRLGLLSASEAIRSGAHDVLPLLFQSGVSTSPVVTNLSGRGLGLAIVREQVEKLAGTISIDTQPDVGTVFSIVLPITHATLHGLIVRVQDHLFVLPTVYVERVVRICDGSINTVENGETITLDGHAVALVRLAETLEISQQRTPFPPAAHVPAVVLAVADRRTAFQVDEVLDDQDILVKSLGKQLSRVRNIAGATVLQTGDVVPILHVPDFIHSAVRTGAASVRSSVVPNAMGVTQQH